MELGRTRSDIMERVERLEDAANRIRDDIAVNMGAVAQVSPHFLLRVKLYLAAYTWRVGLRCSSRQSATCVYITPRPAPCHYVYFCFSQAKLMH